LQFRLTADIQLSHPAIPILAASLCLRDVAFAELFRNNIAALFILKKNKQVTGKEFIRHRQRKCMAFVKTQCAGDHGEVDHIE